MTREEAITILKDISWQMGSVKRWENIEAIDMAIEALHREEAEEKGYCHRIRPSNVEVVVRCKNCKHWSGNGKMHNNHLCKRAQDQNIDYWTRGDDFCSYGECKGGEDE